MGGFINVGLFGINEKLLLNTKYHIDVGKYIS